ncbi:DUF6338 family protein [Rhodococcoides fascians]|uniref:DUF6338 family protein n=1 Tax=Rhodococcoides fascians TaxID=1828 RepID=UPI002ACEC61A|nr:DUF6338 family protein [Rhodococcus fascians]WQH27576.1 DUF6338 family protein [Rhodococcus fascians]
MALPESLFQLLVLLLLVVPGIVFTYVRRWLRGPSADDKDFSVRLIHAIAASVVFDSLYLVAVGPQLLQMAQGLTSGQLDSPRITGLTVLTLTVIIPTLVALVAHLRYKKGLKLTVAERRNPIPTAWDYAAPQRTNCYVRIKTNDGKWIGGWMPQGFGYVSTYPESRDIFIPCEFKMSSKGEFLSPIEGSEGVYVPLTGSERVAWVRPGPIDQAEGSSD